MMQDYGGPPSIDGWPQRYGLGIYPNAYPVKEGEDDNITLREVVGHYGNDWGSAA